MSKKHHKSQEYTYTAPSLSASHAAEYRIIKHDLLRVIVLNAIYLTAVLALYFTNQKSHYFEGMLSSWLHF